MSNGADSADEVALARHEMQNLLDELDRLRRAYQAGTGTLAEVDEVVTRTYEATDRYFDAMRKAGGGAEAPEEA